MDMVFNTKTNTSPQGTDSENFKVKLFWMRVKESVYLEMKFVCSTTLIKYPGKIL